MAVVNTIIYRRDIQLRQAANAIFDLAVTDGPDLLVDTIFQNTDDRDLYLPYFTSLVGPLPEEDVAEGQEEDLDALAEIFRQSCPRLPPPRLPTLTSRSVGYNNGPREDDEDGDGDEVDEDPSGSSSKAN